MHDLLDDLIGYEFVLELAKEILLWTAAPKCQAKADNQRKDN